ncbi:hypothetical protein D9611_015025 [Ephemerocybe angulata]|uniref:Uncharacterized protein n=1 Tax=Ephemerocybe angulata TaxID=980116 RepID=A0A8H5C9Y8_9AGAR|nr:hypothetical protein D9611_015025 [Tulosesus angulatus]
MEALSRDAVFIMDVASVAGRVGNKIRVEAAHIVASLSYSSESALETLLRLQTPASPYSPYPTFRPPIPSHYDPRTFELCELSEIVDPSKYDLRPETTGLMRMEMKEPLGLIFAIETLDILLPPLLSPSPATPTPSSNSSPPPHAPPTAAKRSPPTSRAPNANPKRRKVQEAQLGEGRLAHIALRLAPRSLY